MAMRKPLLPLLLLLLGVTGGLQAADKSRQPARPVVAADGQGGARLFWYMPPARTGSGWRLETDDGRVLIERIVPREPADANDKGARVFVALAAASDWDYARAAGLAAEVQGLAPRRSAFVLRRLGGDGRPDGYQIRSESIDLAQATSLPPQPTGLRAEARPEGVKLHWQPAAAAVPVLAYLIERDDGRSRAALSEKPLVTGSRWPEGQAVHQDQPGVSETEVVYRVHGVDLLGRHSAPATVRLFVPDFTALRPPLGLQARSKQTPIELSWQANASANTKGYLVERAFQTSGPWEVLTPRGTGREIAYTDREARPGSTLFYRLRAIGPRGDVGEPGQPLPVNVRGEPPAAPAGLAAEVGHSRVRLNWQAAAGAAAYHVERRAGEARAWSRLTTTATPETRYDDIYGGSPGGRFEYRVYAVAPDSQTGEPGAALSVALPDTTPPPPPHITAGSGENGRVRLAFRAAAPEADTALVLVLRGAGAEEPGLVIGDPIAVGKGEFIDSWVEAGKRYVYRLVAVDAAGNRGDPGAAVQVRVGTPPLGVPDRPEARYLAEPFAHVKLTFAAPPKGLRILVEAGEGKGEGEHWRPAAGPVVGGEAIDLAPRRGTPRYRLRFQSAGGAAGEASAEVRVEIP